MEDETFGDLDDTILCSNCRSPALDFPHSSWEQFTENLTAACQPYFPQRIPEYRAVHVLLLNWEADDIGTFRELEELRDLFHDRFAYSTEIWPIPSSRPENALEDKLGDVKRLYGSEGCLIIVYYGGHGELKRDGRSVWAANLGPRSPKLEWSSLQPTLKRAECDVLILLDCCFASSAVRSETNGINEIIAACGRESEMVASGEKTFTQNLLRKMKSFGDQPFAAIEIYKRMIKDRKRLRQSPQYDNLFGWKKPSIVLVPRKLLSPSARPSITLAHSTTSSSSVGSQPSRATSETSISRTSEALDGPRVLLALSLEVDADIPELKDWVQWLTNGAPSEIRNLNVKYESIYRGHSTLLLVSMPITTWARLPPSSGFRFVDFVTSENLIPQLVAGKGMSKSKSNFTSPETHMSADALAENLFAKTAVLSNPEPAARLYWNQGKTLEGHIDWVSAVTFSPDGKQIASASWDKTVNLWDAATGALRQTLDGHIAEITAVAFSPDGKQIASVSLDKTVKLWESATGVLLRTLEDHKSWVNVVVYSPDGKQIASGSRDRTVKLWDSTTGALRQTLEGHKDCINAVAFSPDGKQIVSVSDDSTGKLWDSATGSLYQTLEGYNSRLSAVAFSPEGKKIASAPSDMKVMHWNIDAGALRRTLRGYRSRASAVVFSPDGKQIASGSRDETVKLWDSATGALRQTLDGHIAEITAVAFSPDGKQIASVSLDRTIKLWDSAKGVLRRTLEGHRDFVNAVVLSPDGKQIVSVSGDRTVKLWDLATGALRQTLEGHNDWVSAVAFSPDGKQIASASSDTTVKLWDLAGGNIIPIKQNPLSKYFK